jgi:hypothetical protein
VIDLADMMAEGDQLDEGYRRQFDGKSWTIEFDLGQVVIVVIVLIVVAWLLARLF